MSKLILEFNMPEEEREAQFAVQGESYACVLKNLYQKKKTNNFKFSFIDNV